MDLNQKNGAMNDSEKVLWEILANNEKYLESKNNDCEGHAHILRLAFQLSTLNKKEYTKFTAHLFKKYYDLFTAKHLKVFQLYAISHHINENELPRGRAVEVSK